MRKLILTFFMPLLAAPFFAHAQTATPPCRFSKKTAEQNQIVTRGCNEKLCSHVVICGKTAKTVTCKAQSGTCDGYDANDCVAKATTVEAEFDTVDRRPKAAAAPAEGAGGR